MGKRFRFDVSRHISTKGTLEEKERQMEKRLNKSHPCNEKHFARDLSVTSKQLGLRMRFQPQADAWKKTGTALLKTGQKVRDDAMGACRFWIDGHREVLLEAMDTQKRGRMNDVNFFKIVCL